MYQIIEKVNTLNYRHEAGIRVMMISVYAALAVYYWLLIEYLSFDISGGSLSFILESVYDIFDPFTVCAYILGCLVLLHYMIYRDILLKILASAFYGVVICLSLLTLMGNGSLWAAMIFLPHFIIIMGCVAVTIERRKKKIA